MIKENYSFKWSRPIGIVVLTNNRSVKYEINFLTDVDEYLIVGDYTREKEVDERSICDLDQLWA